MIGRNPSRKITTLIATTLCALAIPAAAQAGIDHPNDFWSGYYVRAKPGVKVGYVWTEFNVPRADCAKTKGKTSLKWEYVHNSTAIWAGIDGAGSHFVEQGGVYFWCDTDSHAHYTAFWEMYREPPEGEPVADSARPVPLPNVVHPGDEMVVIVEKLRTSYQIRISDIGHWGVVEPPSTLNGTAPDTSGETIIEAAKAYLTAYYGSVSTVSIADAIDTAFPGEYGPQLDYCADGPESTSHKAYVPDATPGPCYREYPLSTFNFESSFSEAIPHS